MSDETEKTALESQLSRIEAKLDILIAGASGWCDCAVRKPFHHSYSLNGICQSCGRPISVQLSTMFGGIPR